MKEYNAKLSFKQIMKYFIPAIALFALLVVSNNAISCDGSMRIFGIIALLFNIFVIAENVISLAKEYKSKE